MNMNNNNCEMPCVAETPDEYKTPDTVQFYFEVAEDKLLEKDQVISQLQGELLQLKEFISEQGRQKIARDIAIRELSSVVEDIVSLYPTFIQKKYQTDEEGYNKRIVLALVKGHENVNNIIDYIDKFKNMQLILRLMQSVIQNITFENASYEEKLGHALPNIWCKQESASSIVGFKFVSYGNWTKYEETKNGSDYEFGYLKHQMDDIILRTIGIGFYYRSVNACFQQVVKSRGDNIKYQTKQEHAEIWEYKKMFSKRLVDAIASYIESLLQNK